MNASNFDFLLVVFALVQAAEEGREEAEKEEVDAMQPQQTNYPKGIHQRLGSTSIHARTQANKRNQRRRCGSQGGVCEQQQISSALAVVVQPG